MQILAIANQKGGSGKSTLAIHVAYAAVEAGQRVLLVDFDRQGSLSLSFPLVNGAASKPTASMLFGTKPLPEEPEMLSEHLSIVRADETLAQIRGDVPGIEKRPTQFLRLLGERFDLCVIDTPGSIGFNPPMTIAALVAADAVVCPFGVGLFESAALAELWGYLRSIKTTAYNPQLRLMGLLPSKVNTRSPEEMAALADLRTQFGSVILPVMLGDRTAVKQAVARRRPVWQATKGEGQLAAAREWRAACNHILGNLNLSHKVTR